MTLQRRWFLTAMFALLVCGLFAGVWKLNNSHSTSSAAKARATVTPAQRQQVLSQLANLPLSFEANQGQTDSSVKFMARGTGYTAFFTPTEATFELPAGQDQASSDRQLPNRGRTVHSSSYTAVRMNMLGANPNAAIRGDSQLPGVSNYYQGNDPSQWKTGIQQFARINYSDVYPGVGLTFHGAQHQMEFDYIVQPGASPQQIAMSFDGVRSVTTDASGDLVLNSSAGDLRFHKPVAYQEKNGVRVPVDASFAIANNKVGFTVGEYDRSHELVIDPAMVYSLLRGSAADDVAEAIAVDSSSHAYITGYTGSSSFPHTTGTYKGKDDIFLYELKSDGTLVFSTLLGGTGDDVALALALLPGSATPDIFVAGDTSSADFPKTTGPAYGGGPHDGFVARFNNAGALVYATYVGGSGDDFIFGLQADAAGNAYFGGSTRSSNLPTLNAYQAAFPGVPGGQTGMVGKLDTTGASTYLTYLGGSDGDSVNALALDSANDIIVAGSTISSNFPTTAGVLQPKCGTDGMCDAAANGGTSQDDGFITKFAPTGKTLTFSTFLGGAKQDDVFGVAVDSGGNVYVTGQTLSTNFTTKTPFQASLNGTKDAFISKLNPTGTSLIFSTYLGGSGEDQGVGIALDLADDVYVTGQTTSTTFPTANPTQATLDGASDAFVTELSNSGTSLVFSTYLGGSGEENNHFNGGVAVDAAGIVYVAGNTLSTDFPKTNSTGQAGMSDAFATAFNIAQTGTGDFSLSASPTTVTVANGASGTTTVTVTSTGGFNSAVTLSCPTTLPSGVTCTPSPTSVTPAANGTATSTITFGTTLPSMQVHSVRTSSSNTGAKPLAWGLSAFGLMFGIFFSSPRRRRKGATLLFAMLMIAPAMILTSCGGGGGGGTPPPPTVSVAITPTTATVAVNSTKMFTAIVSNSTNTAVNWLVAGVAGGNATVGTITTAGLYTAPATVPSPAMVNVTAAAQADTSKSASATVTIVQPTVPGSYPIVITGTSGAITHSVTVTLKVQ